MAFDIDNGRPRAAVAEGRKLIAEDAHVSANFRVLGDAWRALGPRTPDPTPEELSSRGKGDTRKVQRKFTPSEYEDQLMSSPWDEANWEKNSKKRREAA